ncbi:MAG TPA: hypothetical protein VHW03_04525 [Chthoniobacterales bacterium]|jgi:hypothetical protein|nr:hypothetical protein [Chthoniobacterales bacterium]
MLNIRTLRDANLTVTKALPAQNSTNASSSIDTANANPGRVPNVEGLILLPATPSLANGQTVTLTFKDSADNSSFAASADVPAQVVTGAGGVGAAALSYQFKLPIGLRRYIRVDATTSATTGDNTAVSYTLGLVF